MHTFLNMNNFEYISHLKYQFSQANHISCTWPNSAIYFVALEEAMLYIKEWGIADNFNIYFKEKFVLSKIK